MHDATKQSYAVVYAIRGKDRGAVARGEKAAAAAAAAATAATAAATAAAAAAGCLQ